MPQGFLAAFAPVRRPLSGGFRALARTAMPACTVLGSRSANRFKPIPMTASDAPPSRDFRTAIAVCIGIAAALGLGWRAPSSLPQAVAAPVAAAVDTVDTGFSLDTAMRLAGAQVPPELESFYFFAMLEPAPEAQDIAELGLKMQAAASERDYLGIAGPDPERNRRTVLAAFDARRDDDLSGMILIYVGPISHREAVAAAARSAKVELRFVAYPEASPPI